MKTRKINKADKEPGKHCLSRRSQPQSVLAKRATWRVLAPTTELVSALARTEEVMKRGQQMGPTIHKAQKRNGNNPIPRKDQDITPEKDITPNSHYPTQENTSRANPNCKCHNVAQAMYPTCALLQSEAFWSKCRNSELPMTTR